MVHVVSGTDPVALDRAAEAVAAGRVVALPTDTVYGLAVDPNQPEAVERLFALKDRPKDVALPILVGGAEQIGLVAATLDAAAAHLAARFWPGPLTLVVPRRRGFIADLGGPASARHTVGVRWPDDAFVAALCGRLGPLAVTSANLHGEAPAVSVADLSGALVANDLLALIVDGGARTGAPSTVVECRGPASRGLREGAIPWAEVFASDGRKESIGGVS